MKKTTQPVDVTVLYTEDCAATPATIELLNGVAQEIDIPVRLREILVQSPEQAIELEFLGSPTVQVSGLDIDPGARNNTNYGFMWRQYGASGTPSRELIAKALADAVKQATSSHKAPKTDPLPVVVDDDHG